MAHKKLLRRIGKDLDKLKHNKNAHIEYRLQEYELSQYARRLKAARMDFPTHVTRKMER